MADGIVRVSVDLGTERTEFLVVLYTDEGGALTGQIVTRALTMSGHPEISLLPEASLGTARTTAVTDAARCSLTAGRNAGRRVARAYPARRPRAAIVAGSRSRRRERRPTARPVIRRRDQNSTPTHAADDKAGYRRARWELVYIVR